MASRDELVMRFQLDHLINRVMALEDRISALERKEKKMSHHAEIYKNVNVEWNKETGYLDIRDQNGGQLALLYVEEAD